MKTVVHLQEGSMGPSDGFVDGLEWEKAFQAALIETDENQLKKKVTDAEAAIFQRLQELDDSSSSAEERQALADACHSLLVVKKEVLKFPVWSGSTSEDCSDLAD
jgi:hypothetical protein